ncbi:Disease resistance rpp13-like protein, partial [Thalictrum thalictroides]
MSAEIVQFLMAKYTSFLQETEKDQNRIPLRKIFEEIKIALEKKIHPSMDIPTRDILMDCLYKLNDAFIECQMLSQSRRKCGILTCSPKELFFLVKIKRDLNKIKGNLIKFVPEASTASSSLDGQVRRENSEHSNYETADISEYYGFKDRIEEIVKSLQQKSEDGLNRIGIVGMGGSGKTTLAQLVLNNAEVQKEFSPRIWVPLSQTVNNQVDIERYILEHLLQELGEKEGAYEQTTDASIQSLLLSLNKHLSGKKYLIVFDDVWHINSWYEQLGNWQLQIEEECNDRLDYGLPKGYGGGIIVTGRLEQVVKKMVGEDNLFQLSAPVLDSDSCWSIFMAAVKQYGTPEDHPTITKMKHEILKKCYGLPLAAKAIGEIISHWRHLGINQIDYGWGHSVNVFAAEGSIVSAGIVGASPTANNGTRLTI